MTLRAVLFDLGGTLLREDGYDFGAAVGAAFDLPALRPEARGLQACTQALSDWVRAIQRDGHIGYPEHDLCQWVRKRLSSSAQATLDDEELEEAMWTAGVRMSAIAGAQRALDAVAEAGLRAAGLSNTIFSARRMGRALDEAGLTTRFEFLLSSAELGLAKPDPRAFHAALERLSLSAETVLYVGDSWTNDVRGAHAAGLRACWIQDGAPPDATPCLQLSDIASLGARLDM